MRIVWIMLVIMLGVNFAGCGSAKRVEVAQKQLPSWYEHPPRSTSSELYAVGEGKSKREAIDNALALLASTLSVSISSDFNAKTVVKEGRVNSSDATYVNQTQSEVKKIRITNYQLLNAAQLGFKRVAVLVKAEKQALFSGLKNELDEQFAVIESRQKNIQKQNALKQLGFYNKSLQELQNLQNTLSVMKVLQKNFDTYIYLQKREALQEKRDAILNKISFSIKADAGAKRFVSAVESGLSKEKFRIKKSADKYHFSVFISAKIKRAQAYGFNIARAEISLTTKDSDGQIIATNLLHIDGQSSQGYEIALQDVTKKLNAKIEKEGIFKILNLNIY